MNLCLPGYSPWFGSNKTSLLLLWDGPGGSHSKESACNADPDSIPELGGSPGEGNGNPLQHSCLEKPMDRGAGRATVHGVTESDMTEQLTLSLHSYFRLFIDYLYQQFHTV